MSGQTPASGCVIVAVCKPACVWLSGLAAVPSGVSVRERESGGLVDVTWRAVQTNLTGTVLYVIEGRWMVGQQYREDRATGWRQIAQVRRPLAGDSTGTQATGWRQIAQVRRPLAGDSTGTQATGWR